MRRIVYKKETTLRGRRCGTPNLSKKETLKAWETTTFLRPLNQLLATSCRVTNLRGTVTRKRLFHMEGKFTNAFKEFQAAEEELAKLWVALSNAKRTTVEVLHVENTEETEKIKFLTGQKQRNDPLLEKYNEEKVPLNLTLKKSKAEESRVVFENRHLKVIIEEECKE
uniref:PH domain-containing protein n=1 Tax=Loa loa TaxID=7209 RepID=A0A1I7VTB0_LOALO